MSSVGIEIIEGVVLLRGLPAVYLRKHDAVVISDLHLGYEEAMARQGVFLPRLQSRKAIRIIKQARDLTQSKRLVINGDIKHEFGRLLRSEKLEVAKLLRAAYDAGYKEVVVVRGNHDNYIKPIVESLGGEMVEELVLDDIFLTHGHKRIENPEGIIVIGHEHPSMSISIGGVKARFPVFLLVPLKEERGVVVVLPASGAYQTGNTIGLSRESYLSPIVKEWGRIGDITPIIVDETEGLMPLPRLSLLEELVF